MKTYGIVSGGEHPLFTAILRAHAVSRPPPPRTDETRRRVLRAEINHTNGIIAGLDADIAKLHKRRDRHVFYLGRCEEQLDPGTP